MKTCQKNSPHSCAHSPINAEINPEVNSGVNPIIAIDSNDLPLSCPRPHAPLWSMHPRVFLPIEESEGKQITCPYCSAVYQLN